MLDLESIELIKQLKARYFRFLDTRNIEGLQTVFTSDATASFVGGDYDFQLDGWEQLEAFIKSHSRARTSACTTGITRKSVSMAIPRQASGTSRTFLSPSSMTSPSREVRSMRTNIAARAASGALREPVISGCGKNIINAATMFVCG